MTFLKLFIFFFYKRNAYGIVWKELGISFSSDMYPRFPHRIYRRKTKPAYTMLRAHALFHHVISLILEALRRWTNKNMYYYRAIKYLYCFLKPYFRGPSGSNVAHEFLMEGTIRLVLTRLNCQCCMFFPYKIMAHRWPLFWRFTFLPFGRNEISFR